MTEVTGLSRRWARITGTGSCLPQHAVNNAELAERLAKIGVETSDEWITERTGIRQRFYVEENQNNVDLAHGAALQALAMAGRDAAEIDLIVLATSTPDQVFPSTACLLQQRLGVSGAAAFDVQAVCSGFVYALSVANAMIVSGQHKRALVVGSEVFSRILDWNDRTTCVLFGDGAGAVVLEASEEPGVLSCVLHADGNQSGILNVTGRICGGRIEGHPYLYQDGQSVYKMAVTSLASSANEVLANAGMAADQIDWMIPHQANIRIMQTATKKLGLPLEKLVVTVDRYGNTSAATVPLALDAAVRDGRVQKGQHLMLQGVGGGFTWGACLVRF